MQGSSILKLPECKLSLHDLVVRKPCIALPSGKGTLHSPPNYLFQKFTEKTFKSIQKKLEQENYEEEENYILCKVCQHKITSFENKIEINGQHQHVFTNPSGFIYEIGCFSLANGCVNRGIPSLEYTWFSGYAWRFAFCSSCFMHLGWFYQSGNDSFYGLILENLEQNF